MGQERRKNFRIAWNLPGTIDIGDGVVRPCIVNDLSNGGARISGVEVAKLPDEFKLRIAPTIRVARHCRVMWRTKSEVGVEFIHALTSYDQPATAETASAERKQVTA